MAASVKVFVVVVAAVKVTERFYGFHLLRRPNAVYEHPVNAQRFRLAGKLRVATPDIGSASEQLDRRFSLRFLKQRDKETVALGIIAIAFANCDITAFSDEDVANSARITEDAHGWIVVSDGR